MTANKEIDREISAQKKQTLLPDKKQQRQKVSQIKSQNHISNQLNKKYMQVCNSLQTFKTSNQENIQWIQEEFHNCQAELKLVGEVLVRKIQNMPSYEKQQLIMSDQQINRASVEYSQHMKHTKNNICENIHRKFKTIKNEAIEEICSDFEFLWKHNYDETNKKIDKVAQVLEQARIEKEQAAQHLIYTFGDQIIKLQQAFSQQKEIRVTNNQKLTEALRKVQMNIDDIFSLEQKQKQAMYQNVEMKLQEVCTQLQLKAIGKD